MPPSAFKHQRSFKMLSFIQSQPSVVERLMSHIETAAISDLLFRILQLDEHPSGAGVLEVIISGSA